MLLILAVVVFAMAQPVFAGGGQVTGDKSQGEPSQNGPTPFGGDTPAGPND